MTAPLVSVIIPAFNRAHSLARSIESVLQQTHVPIELIVVDDGSTDGTAAVMDSYGDRIRSVRQENSGPSSARNTGVNHAKGEIIAFLDSDDTWERQKIERQVKLMIEGGSKVACCVCNARNMINGIPAATSFEIADVECKLAEGYWMNPAELIASRFLLFNQVVAIRRNAFETIGGYKQHMRLLEDHDLAFRLSLLGPWAFVSECLVTKYEEADGLGVQARKDQKLHAVAWARALEGFLSENLDDRKLARRIIRQSLKDVAIEISAATMMESASLVSRVAARLMMSSLRLKAAIRRRLPSWPRVHAVTTLV